MKTSCKLICLAAIAAAASCKKKDTPPSNSTTTTENYSSVNDFFVKNGVAMQTYTVSGTTGGSFTSPQGTVVTIPANAFVTQSNAPVTGNVTIQFKDLYKKSDMLLSNMPTMMAYGAPLKSGGEFFIKASANNSAVVLAPGKKITAAQPVALTGILDSAMQPFVQQKDSSGTYSWGLTSADSINYVASNYLFSLYQFNVPVDSGSWSNSDNSSYFSSYPQTTLTLQPNDNLTTYGTNVFLVFKNISSMVHVYHNGTNFPYYYAPQGLQCTLVAVGIKSGILYSSFVPITISSNQTVNFSLSQTTTSAFITQLKTLN
ncbi:MAG: hypothetical protein HY063_11975 [Bacteroidetes bacterium]|nr:hypothetical protein [Bacteroidota bacterium]